jgi:G3E family GTPase
MLEGVIVLVDGQAVMGYSADARLADTIQRQLSAADLVVLNKVDLMSSEQVAAVHAWLADHAPRAWIHHTQEASVPLDLLRGPPSTDAAASRSVDPPRHRDGDPFCTWTFETEELLSAGKLRRLLQAMPGGIVRAKGIVRTDAAPSRATVFQFAGRSRYLKPTGPWHGGASHIVFIGMAPAPPFAALRRLLREASADAAEDVGHER